MKITGITAQQKDRNRVNIMVDGTYRFSLDIFQVTDLGVYVGNEYSEQELIQLEIESQFGKLYARALEYCMMRPHSAREIRDYLYRKTLTTKARNRKTGDVYDKVGVSRAVADSVFARLDEKGYINDERFARYWVENRRLSQGASKRKLRAELQSKGVELSLIERLQSEFGRTDQTELLKVIERKRRRYPDKQKLMQYLARQGFSYDDIKHALE